MFAIDENNSISWGDANGEGFSNLDELTNVAEACGWSKQTVTDIWNGFAGVAGPFRDLKPQKLFKNRPYGLAQIWKAIQRLVPSDAASEPAAPKTTCQECNGSGEFIDLDGLTYPCENCDGQGYLAAVADTVEDMPKKKAKAKKAPKGKGWSTDKPFAALVKKKAAAVEAKAGSNLNTLIAMMKRKNGVSIEEAMAKTGWTATHSVRGRISILKSKGMPIESFKHETRGRVYRTAGGKA